MNVSVPSFARPGGRVARARAYVRDSSDQIGPGSLLLPHSLLRRGPWVEALADGALMAAALVLAVLVRFDFRFDRPNWARVLPLALVLVVAFPAIGSSLRLYQRRWRYGSYDELRALVLTVGLTAGTLVVANAFVRVQFFPRSSPIIAGAFALVGMAGARYSWRLWLDYCRRPTNPDAERCLVFGAGEGGCRLVETLLHNPHSTYVPVALLDDDPLKANLRVMDVKVQGDRTCIDEVAARTGATALVVAIPSADSELLADLDALGRQAGLKVFALPPVDRLLGAITIGDLRPVTDEELLSREQADLDLEAIAGYLTGKVVLVTGAGGSIGSELCRQIHRFEPASLIMLDRDESALHAVQLSIEGRALLDTPDLVLLDIRERDQLQRLFAERRPDVVFHAAALKHLPMLERHPHEAFKTNVWGTWHVLEAAITHGVERFVNISTDKAANPISNLGYSKRLAERLTAHAAAVSGRPFLSVRFGNVLGSRGSVLTAFRAQIDNGGPVTVTDPDVTRYFMTVNEAVRLTIEAGAIGDPGEVLVLDMGEPVLIADVARRLVEQAGGGIEIVFTGLRQGEKLHEDLFSVGEVDVRRAHPLISHVPAPALNPADLPRSITSSSDLRGLATVDHWVAVAGD